MFQIVFLFLCGAAAGQSLEREAWIIFWLNIVACVMNGMVLAHKIGAI